MCSFWKRSLQGKIDDPAAKSDAAPDIFFTVLGAVVVMSEQRKKQVSCVHGDVLSAEARSAIGEPVSVAFTRDTNLYGLAQNVSISQVVFLGNKICSIRQAWCR